MANHSTGPFLNAVKSRGNRQMFGDAPIQFDPDYYYRLYDFFEQALDTTNDYTLVKDAGASVATTADARGGRFTITSAATTDNDGGSLQVSQEQISLDSGKPVYFEAMGQVSDATQLDLFVGLCENFATDPENCLTSSNRVGFQKDDGSAVVLCKTEASDTETSTTTAISMVAATDMKFGIRWDGVNKVEFYINRELVATHTANIPSANMTPAIFHLSGDASGTKSSNWDYIAVAMKR